MAEESGKIEELNRFYEQANSIDQEIFAEMRSNILLAAGDHFAKRTRDYMYRNIRESDHLSNSQKLRVTKNHIHRIVTHYTSNIMGLAPGVSPAPKNPSEIQDQKAADLNKAVWQDGVHRYKLKAKFRNFCKDFVQIGECGLLLKWNPNKGAMIGYEPQVDPMTSEPLVDQMTGEQVPDEKRPIFEGEFEWQRLFGFNTLRSPEAKELEESPILVVRYMSDKKTLSATYKDQPDKLKFIQESSKDEYVVFDAEKFSYQKAKDQVMVREFYYRKCHEYPEGYFRIATEAGVLEEGPLPYGIFPIVTKTFLDYPTTPRGRSIIKVARPYQAEINRASSSQAMAQITLGDDKLLYQAGTKLSAGAMLPGVRGLQYQGAQPMVLPGRDGAQYTNYIIANIDEMYRAVNLEELNSEKSVNLEAHSLLFVAASQKTKFKEYAEKFEEFMIEVCELYLDLARHYLPDTAVIWAVGKNERVNLEEFRTVDPLRTIIKVEAQDETVETKLGRHLTFMHMLQYVGQQLDKKDIGRIMRSLPFANHEEAFGKLTLPEDNAKNVMLALDRGEGPLEPMQYEDAEFVAEALTFRMRQADFKYLRPEIQQAYQITLQGYEVKIQQKMQELKAAQSEFIPASGAMIGCDMYVPAEDPTKAPKRVRVPYQALQWLMDQLKSQGMAQEQLEQLNPGVVSDIIQMQGGQGSPPQ